MSLAGIENLSHADRKYVDLLFFPTGGGNTEAYLGLAAFTLVLRRLRNPGLASAGVAVLMRYTLRNSEGSHGVRVQSNGLRTRAPSPIPAPGYPRSARIRRTWSANAGT
jgi:hypothetical protein